MTLITAERVRSVRSRSEVQAAVDGLGLRREDDQITALEDALSLLAALDVEVTP